MVHAKEKTKHALLGTGLSRDWSGGLLYRERVAGEEAGERSKDRYMCLVILLKN